MQSKWCENEFLFWWGWNSLSQKGFALSLVLNGAVFGIWKWAIEQWAHDEGFLSKRTILKMEFLENYCSFSRLISKQDNVLLEFTTARLIAIYDSVLLQFAIAWLLQFSTTIITIYDRYYNSRHHYNSTQARRASCGTTVWNVRKESEKTKGSSNVNRSCYIFLLYQRTLCREM